MDNDDIPAALRSWRKCIIVLDDDDVRLSARAFKLILDDMDAGADEIYELRSEKDDLEREVSKLRELQRNRGECLR